MPSEHERPFERVCRNLCGMRPSLLSSRCVSFRPFLSRLMLRMRSATRHRATWSRSGVSRTSSSTSPTENLSPPPSHWMFVVPARSPLLRSPLSPRPPFHLVAFTLLCPYVASSLTTCMLSRSTIPSFPFFFVRPLLRSFYIPPRPAMFSPLRSIVSPSLPS